MVRSSTFIIFLLSPFVLFGGNTYDYSPYFTQDLQIELTPYYAFRQFGTVNSDDRDFHAHETGQLFGIDMNFTALTEYTLGICSSLAQTTRTNFGPDSLGFIFGKQWSNDLLGDPFAFSTFGLFTINSASATRDFILYHSSQFEFEIHGSIGKEWIDGPTWCFRSWFDLGFGQGTSGSPYLKAFAYLEKNFWDIHILSIFFRTWVGWGGDPLNHRFRGYGSVKHRNLDIGVRYAFSTCYWGYLGFDASLGCVSVNYPRLPIELLLFWRFNLGP